MSESTKFHDNTQVGRLKYGYSYFAITLQEPKDEYSPYTAAVYRYCVPGRIDSYRFDWVISKSAGLISRMRFCSEGGLSLPAALKMLHADLEKPRVVEMVKRAASDLRLVCESKVLLEFLLDAIAPRSKALRHGRKAYAAMIALRKMRKQYLVEQSGIPK